jgi:hypothetical protein
MPVASSESPLLSMTGPPFLPNGSLVPVQWNSRLVLVPPWKPQW